MSRKKVPVHIAIIPDGNRRWAKRRGLAPTLGHKKAAEENIPEILRRARKLGIKYLTIWVLSTENLIKRDKREIAFLFGLLKQLIDKNLAEFIEDDVRFRTIGDLAKLPKDVQKKLSEAKEKTKNCQSYTFILAINYGGRDEIVRAVNALLEKGVKRVDRKLLEEHLDTHFAPPPDLIIRTGKEKRLSGFMLWQSEYSELYFSDLFFPDFTADEFEKAVREFGERERRFGK